jgi:putative ABC transport system permease protein
VSLLAVKLRRDLRATWPRILMMVIAVAVSLTVFGAVLYSWSTIDRETERAYLSTSPASATILLERPVDEAQMAAIAAETRGESRIIDMTGRTQFTTPVQLDGRTLDNQLQVFVATPDDPMRIATFEVEQRSWPPPAGEILLGRDTLELLGVAVGDTMLVETPAGEPARLRVTGVVNDPSLAPADQEQVGHGYLSAASLADSGEPVLLDQLKIQVAGLGETVPSRDREAIVAVARDLGERLQQEQGVAIREIQVPEPYAHPHQGQADAILNALLVGAGAALLLSTILVANMLNGLFTHQIPQIGIMKAIGARSVRIGRLYLAMTLTVTVTATLLALGPGILVSRAFVSWILGTLAIEPASLVAPWWTFLVVLGAGLLLPVVLALLPLVKTSVTTVRAAIDHHGGTAKAGAASGVLARLSRVRGLNRGLLMALRNTVRRPARFLLAATLLASAGMMFVAGLSTRDGGTALADSIAEQLKWDLTVELADSTSVEKAAAIVEQVPQVSRVEGWTMAGSGVAGPGQIPVTRTYPDQGHGRLTVTAVPAETAMFTPPKLRDGRWLEPQETGAIVLNLAAVANAEVDVEIGDTVQLSVDGRPTDWRVTGISEEPGASSGAFVTAVGFADATGQPLQANSLRIATESQDEPTREAVAEEVEDLLAGAGIEVRSAESVGPQEASAESHLTPILVVLLAFALPMAVIGCIGLASTMSANVLERTREFGVMHAIGARPSAVRRIIIAEGIFLALASCLLAILPTLGLTAVMGSVLGNAFLYAPLPFRVSVLASVMWVVLVVLGAVLATEAAASRASRLTVRQALAYL